ncbi:PEP-CTERM sorting domain-containing protein [Alteromonas pelagimontana]|uniref:PEP-CTERM sorting domain-containing protein n=1 Tax=Alteromonas pelagimontana TaxID=1858656 RepID=A0A6M4M8Z0_9ALTE|nr:PEP-CTERM sorting domain-containing protein [Alteromonas pelagimontana]QJR79597.1 PEP-CTERM sorting domain-containing protein [Alteromonas pelagimontana]
MKLLTAAILLSVFTSLSANASFTKISDPFSSFGKIGFGYPTIVGDTNLLLSNSAYKYVGFEYQFTDTFTWLDADIVTEFNDAIVGDFQISLMSNGHVFHSEIIEDTGADVYTGSFYNTTPFDIQGFIHVVVEPYAGNGNPAKGVISFYPNSTAFYFSDDTVLSFVPTPATFGLFAFGAIALCLRRQQKLSA